MKNVGGKERALRAVFGSGVVIVDFLASVQIEILFLLVGLWGVLTSAFGYCPFNGLLLMHCLTDAANAHSSRVRP